MYTSADVTIVVLPDDRYSGVLSCLESVARYTPAARTGEKPRLLVADLGYPEALRQALRERLGPPVTRSEAERRPPLARSEAERRPPLALTGELIPLGRLLPMEALLQIRPRLTTPLCVVLGTDVQVTPGWLEPLLRCIDDGADVVTPLILAHSGQTAGPHDSSEGATAAQRGGLYTALLRRVTVDGQTYLLEHRPRCDAPHAGPRAQRRQRAPTDCFDLSCVLMRTEWLHRIELRPLSVHESVDMALQLRLGGARLVSEPRSVVRRPGEDQNSSSPSLPDLLYGLFRWSSGRASRSARLFQRTWGYSFYDEQALRAQLLRRRLALVGRFLGLTPAAVERILGRIGALAASRRKPALLPDPVASSQPLLAEGTLAAKPGFVL